MSRNHSTLFTLAIFGAVSPACSLYVDGDRQQCEQDTDCQALGSEYAAYLCKDSLCQAPQAPVTPETPVDPKWACLDGAGTEPVTGSVRVSITLVDMLSQKPLAGVALALCSKLDGACQFPILPLYESSPSGQLEVEIPATFDGYFQASGADIYPTLIFPPSTRRQRAPSTIPLVPASFFPTMVRGTTVAENRSVVITTALDCLARPAGGLTLTSPDADAQTFSYVIAGGLPSRSATATDDSGSGGFMNVPAGPFLVKSALADSGRPVGAAAVQSRPGHISMVLIMPTGN